MDTVGDEMRNLIVNYLPNSVTPQTFRGLFQQFGDIESSRIIMDHATGMGMGYGFVKFKTDDAASTAIAAMNGSSLENKTIKVSYAKKPNQESTEANLYVAQLDKHITKTDLEQLFSSYGAVIDAKVLVDATGQSRGVGFVRYESRDQGQVAINELNGKIPHGSVTPIVVKFAEANDKKRKAQAIAGAGYGRPVRYDPMAGAGRQRAPPVPAAAPAAYAPALYQYSSHQQPTVVPTTQAQTYCLFVYNLPAEADDSLLYRLFGPYGAISNVKITRDAGGKSKGYGFVHFIKFEDANQAIVNLNGALLENKLLQVSFKAPKQ